MNSAAIVGDAEKRAAMEQVLQSATFLRANQVRNFLRYICEMELAGRGVRVNSIHPGLVRTPMTEHMPDDIVPIDRVGQTVVSRLSRHRNRSERRVIKMNSNSGAKVTNARINASAETNIAVFRCIAFSSLWGTPPELLTALRAPGSRRRDRGSANVACINCRENY